MVNLTVLWPYDDRNVHSGFVGVLVVLLLVLAIIRITREGKVDRRIYAAMDKDLARVNYTMNLLKVKM